jgi:hypothetical protein
MPWKTWPPQQSQNQPPQGWRGYAQGNKPYQQPYQPFPYQQFRQNQPQNSYFQLSQPAPQLTQPQKLHLPSNRPPPRPTQLPSQPISNPNNKVEKPMYNIDEGPSYSVLLLQNIHLRSGKVLPKDSLVIIEKQIKKEEIPNTKKLPIDNQVQKSKTLNIQTPPFPERLVKEKLPISLLEFDVLDELRNVCVKIPLLQAIKDIPIYTKAIKEFVGLLRGGVNQ